MPDQRSEPLRLRAATPLAIGQLREIYAHPRDPGLLVKVVREDVVGTRWSGWQRWHKRLPRALHYAGYVRELKEYIAVQARHPGAAAPICVMVGLVDTDLGLGLVSELVAGADGAPGPTLGKLYECERGFPAWVEDALAVFLRDLLASNVIVGDLHAWNIVHGSDSLGGPRFVLVDGFGEKNIVPRNSMSSAVNGWNTRRLYRRMRAQLVDLVRFAPA